MNKIFAAVGLLLLGACQGVNHYKEDPFADTSVDKTLDTIAAAPASPFKDPGTWEAKIVATKKDKNASLVVTGNIAVAGRNVRLSKTNKSLQDSVLVLSLSAAPDQPKAAEQTIIYKERIPNADQYKKVNVMYQDKLVSTIHPENTSQ